MRELIKLFFNLNKQIRIIIYYNTGRIFIKKNDYPIIIFYPSSKLKTKRSELTQYSVNDFQLFLGADGITFVKFLKILEEKSSLKLKLKNILEKEILLSNVDI